MRPQTIDRFCEKFICNPNGCWDWVAAMNPSGYGAFGMRIDGRYRIFNAHNAAWRIFMGPVNKGFHVHHKCGRRCCVNPNHLECISVQEHIGVRHFDLIVKKAEDRNANTHCHVGHEYTLSNTGRNKDGHRYCKKCKIKDARKARLIQVQKQKAEGRWGNKFRFLEHNGEVKNIAGWSRVFGVNQRAIWARLNLGWGVEEAITTPVRKCIRS